MSPVSRQTVSIRRLAVHFGDELFLRGIVGRVFPAGNCRQTDGGNKWPEPECQENFSGQRRCTKKQPMTRGRSSPWEQRGSEIRPIAVKQKG